MNGGLSIRIASAGWRGRSILSDSIAQIPQNTFTAVIGRSGAGKTTLLSCIAGLLPFDGSVVLDGVDLCAMSMRERASVVSMMPQMVRTPHVPVSVLVSYGRYPHRTSALGGLGEADRAAIARARRAAGLDLLWERDLDTLSGGEVRRAYLGAVLAQDTPLLLLDEPTSGLDADCAEDFLSMLSDLRLERERMVIAVLHDLSAALRHADRILLMDGGRIRFLGDVGTFCETELPAEIFGVRILWDNGVPAVLTLPRCRHKY